MLVSLRLLNPGDGGTYRIQRRSQFLSAFVLAAGPEEALQTVALSAWHDVNMKMGDALADAVVGGDKRAFRLHGQLDGGREHFYILEKWRDERLRKILDRFKVIPGDNEAVAGKQGAMVQEGDGVRVLENAGAVVVAHDFAEGAVFIEFGGFSAHLHWRVITSQEDDVTLAQKTKGSSI